MNYTIDSIKAIHSAIIYKLGYEEYPDGTYDIDTLKPVEFDKGYQVTFYTENMFYSDSQYEALVNLFLEFSADGNTYVGYFDGNAEISWRIADKQTAITLANRFNQVCVWDWKNSECIATGGTGRNE